MVVEGSVGVSVSALVGLNELSTGLDENMVVGLVAGLIDIGLREFSTGIDDTGLNEFSTGIDDTGLREFSTGIDDTGLREFSTGLLDGTRLPVSSAISVLSWEVTAIP